MTATFPEPVQLHSTFAPLPKTLSDDEINLVQRLMVKGRRENPAMELTDAYYRGEQVITSLGIALPPQLSGLRSVVGWPAVAIDPLEERLRVEGFRLPKATDADMDLWDLWQANDMPAEVSMAFTDALSMGRSWLTVGSPYEPGDPPVICVESPLNMAVGYDLRARIPVAALQIYFVDGMRHAALYQPNETVLMAENERGVWQVADRDQHNFGRVPVVRLANRPRSNQRDGASELTPAVRSLVDSACRKLVNLEVASELYSVPQKYILGATEADFQSSDGTPKTAWDTYITNILGLERNEDGDLPTVGQFIAYDPSVYTKVLDWYASAMAGLIGATPQDLGLYTQGNPPSADAIKFVESRRDRKALRKQALFGSALAEAMKLALMFGNGGELPAEMERLEVDWADPSTPTPGATTDALQKQVAAGIVPPTSDVVLKAAGYSAVERARLQEDRQAYEAEQAAKAEADAIRAQKLAEASQPEPNQPPAQ